LPERYTGDSAAARPCRFSKPSMRRCIGVTLSAVVTILGSVLLALLAALLLVGYIVSRGDDPDMPLPSSPGDPPGLKTGFRIGIVCFYASWR
jgi:hypothetical protein